MKELAADGIPVAVTCRVLQLARQPYYRWLAEPVTAGEVTEAYRANALFDAHRDDPEFGYRFLADEARAAGEAMAERTAWRICSNNGHPLLPLRRVPNALHHRARRSTITSSAGTSPPMNEIGCGSVILPGITPMRESCISARSRMCSRGGSWATRSTHA